MKLNCFFANQLQTPEQIFRPFASVGQRDCPVLNETDELVGSLELLLSLESEQLPCH